MKTRTPLSPPAFARTVALALAVALLSGFGPAAARPAAAAGESMEAVEKDLASALKEMEALSKELDRVEEVVKAPKATLLRVEIHAGPSATPPASVRLFLKERLEDDREWPRGEREAFSGVLPSPLVLQIPYFPGTFPARIELFHPNWSAPASAVFQAVLKKGESTTVRLRLQASPGAGAPALTLLEAAAR